MRGEVGWDRVAYFAKVSVAIATIAQFLKPPLRVVLMYAYKKRRRDSVVKQVLIICLVDATG